MDEKEREDVHAFVERILEGSDEEFPDWVGMEERLLLKGARALLVRHRGSPSGEDAIIASNLIDEMLASRAQRIKGLISGLSLWIPQFQILEQEGHYVLGQVNCVTISVTLWTGDRGNYKLFIDSKDPRKCHVDGSDGFPRYYFYLGSLLQELHAWLLVRNLLPEDK